MSLYDVADVYYFCRYNGLTVRAVRKRSQIESFASVLAQMIPSGVDSEEPLHIVDFGSGTGNLSLALAYLFPRCRVTAVDMNARSILLLQQRALAGGLMNITGVVGRIEAFEEHFDVAVALHACGVATDYALYKAQQCRAAYIMCPCCIGKLKFGLKRNISDPHHERSSGSGDSKSNLTEDSENACEMITHPRSQWLSDALVAGSGTISTLVIEPPQISQDAVNTSTSVTLPLEQHISTSSTCLLPPPPPPALPPSHTLSHLHSHPHMSPDELFAAMARAGDISHGEAHTQNTAGLTHPHAHEARLCKCHLELDRNMCMQEAGYQTALMKLLQSELTGKSELLVGVPREVAGEPSLVSSPLPSDDTIVGISAAEEARREQGTGMRFPWDNSI